MADEKEIDPALSDDSAALEPRGEDLASEHLDEPHDYTAAYDESDAAIDDDSEPIVEDPDELAQAEAEVEEMPSTDAEPTPLLNEQPSRRPKRRTQTSTLIEDAPDDAGTALDETLGATAVTASSLRPKRRSAEVVKKETATPRRTRRAAAGDEPTRRTGPVKFVEQVGSELRKVVWPTGSQLVQYFVVVLVFVLAIIAIVMGLDFLFGWLLLKAFG